MQVPDHFIIQMFKYAWLHIRNSKRRSGKNGENNFGVCCNIDEEEGVMPKVPYQRFEP